ncbi:MAG TPA: hypothetical protein VLH86_05645 [Patescibacteria group bacterium]|nr:hypothetical protein [Patescibacteria group bacterium]
MDPQNAPVPSPDSEKPKEDVAGGPGDVAAHEQARPWQPTATPEHDSPASTASAVPSWHAASDPSPAPSMPATPMPASIVGGVPPKASKKKMLIALVVGVGVLVLGGASAAAYFGYVVPNKPQNVLKTALVNSFSESKVKSAHFNGKVSVKDKASNQTIAATFTGGANTDGAMDLQASVDAIVTKVTLDVRSVDGSTYYLKVGGLEGLPELMSAYGGTDASAYASVISGLNQQWIEINQSVLSQLGSSATTLKMSQADRDKLAAAYKDHQFLTVQQTLKDEKISGMNSHHYKIAVDKQQLKDFVKAVKDAKLDSVKMSQDELDSFNNSVKDVDFSKHPVDVWVTKDTKLVDQIAFSYEDNQGTLDVRYTVTDYNKPVNVTKPAGAKSLLEVMSQLLMSSGGNDTTIMNELQNNGISL